MKKISVMGLTCWLYKNNVGHWTISANLAHTEFFNKYLYQLLGDDVVSVWQTSNRVHAETRFRNVIHLNHKLHQRHSVDQ